MVLGFLIANAGRAVEPAPAATNASPELTLEQPVNIQVESAFGASKFEQKVTQGPASVSIITSGEIKKLGDRTLADVLQNVRGTCVTYDRNYSYLGMRGFARPSDYNTGLLLPVDGHRVNDNDFDSWLVGSDALVDVDMIDRVEVIRGPSSAICGNSAFLGVLNLVTKRGSAIDGIEASGEAGSFDSYKGRFTYGKRFTNDVELIVSGSFYDSAGPGSLYFSELTNPTPPPDAVLNKDHSRGQWLETEFQLPEKLFERHTLTVGAEYRDHSASTRSTTIRTRASII